MPTVAHLRPGIPARHHRRRARLAVRPGLRLRLRAERSSARSTPPSRRKGASLQSADGFTVHAQMSQNFLSDLTSRAAAVLQQAGAQASAQIAAAQRDVTNAQAEVDQAERPGRRRPATTWPPSRPTPSSRSRNAQAQVDRAQNALSAIDASDHLDPGRASRPSGTPPPGRSGTRRPRSTAAQGPVNDLNSQISSLQGQINQLNSDIAWWNNWYNNSSLVQKAYRWAQLSAEVGWRGTKVAALTTAHGHPAGVHGHRERGPAGRAADPAGRAGGGRELPDRPGSADPGPAGQPRRPRRSPSRPRRGCCRRRSRRPPPASRPPARP